MCAIAALVGPMASRADAKDDPRPTVAEAIDAYRADRSAFAERWSTWHSADTDRLAALADRDDAVRSLDAANGEWLAAQRSLTQFGVAAYIESGASSSLEEPMFRVIEGQTSSVRESLRRRDDRRRELKRRDHDLDRATKASDEAWNRVVDATERADASAELAARAIVDSGTSDLPPIALVAAADAARTLAATAPDCHLSAATLAGLSRVASDHGRTGDTAPDHRGQTPVLQVTAAPVPTGGDAAGSTSPTSVDEDRVGPMQIRSSQWISAAVDGNDDHLVEPGNLFDAMATAANVLCSGGADLSTRPGLEQSIERLVPEAAERRVVLAAGLRYSRNSELGFDPIAAASVTSSPAPPLPVDAGDPSDPTTIAHMLVWAHERLGTPYSQCLGGEARPGDPECPAGTDRFGHGFFDCSGFVSAAYGEIGVSVPTTTEAMSADGAFLARTIADGFTDLGLLQPGDIFLQDGHTGLYVGDGQIIHAAGDQLTQEPLPDWVRDQTFAIIRVVDVASAPPVVAAPDPAAG